MTTHKLHIDELEDAEFDLIAIHSQLEDYRMAYMLNKSLPIVLRKCTESVIIKGKTSSSVFSRFEYEQTDFDACWNLISNSFESEPVATVDQQSLFPDTLTSASTQTYFLPEFRKVDYFLKIENGSMPMDEIVSLINQIDRVTAAYVIESNKIKSKNNLIF